LLTSASRPGRARFAIVALAGVLIGAISAEDTGEKIAGNLTSAGPARLFNIAAKGRIAAGYDADFTVVDLKRRETITDRWVASRAGWTPYHGVAVTGWPIGTIIRGHKVMWEGTLAAPAQGERVRFLETLAS